ncbi:hypothetical protein [Frigoriglobus tundricola]|uniref:Uncharacterized protein n=1 Tax=Frigoriglobus tundricola TaxID=2774151 RepID=A0A6M5YWW1_9BACT|nr:hypothetical protein [Frigoriglobus tundricola]QJW98449.1 hypothetical protein FTUN_6039 [Frigoriglobus tundricola]
MAFVSNFHAGVIATAINMKSDALLAMLLKIEEEFEDVTKLRSILEAMADVPK